MLLFLPILLFTVHSSTYSQNFSEKIIFNTNSNSCFGAVEINSRVYFNYNSANQFKGISTEALIYKGNSDLNLLDSLNLSQYDGNDIFHITNILTLEADKLLVLGQGITQNPHQTETSYALVVDTSLNVLRNYNSGSRTDTIFLSLNATAVNHNLVTGGAWLIGNTVHPGYIVYSSNGTIIKETLLKSLPPCAITALYASNDQIYCGFKPAPYGIATLDTTNYDIQTLDTSGYGMSVGGFFQFNNVPGDIYAYGEYRLHHLGLYKIRNTSAILIDTFASVPNPILQTKSTVVDAGVVSARNENSIYFPTTEGAYYDPSYLQPGLFSHLKLWQIDTAGSVIWSYTKADSAYYFPTKTLATSDGGALFFSMKYDWEIDPSPKTALSIIKLDSNGNFVALHEKEFSYQKPVNFSIYPNPIKTNFNISGIESAKTAAILIYNIDGTLLKEILNPSSTVMDISDITSGTYILRVLYKDGRQGMTKVIKAD